MELKHRGRLLFALGVLLCAACGGSSGTGGAASPGDVAVAPAGVVSAEVAPGAVPSAAVAAGGTLARSSAGNGTNATQTARAGAAQPGAVLKIRVLTNKETNRGGALHILVRDTNKVDYPRETYDDIVKSLSNKTDPETVAWEVVVPGTTSEYSIPYPEKGGLGVYFLFSHPAQRWRHLIVMPNALRVEYRLGADRIETIRIAKSRGGP